MLAELVIRPVEDVDADVVRQVQQIDRGVAALEHAVYTDNAARNKELRALKDDLRASRRIHADVELLPCQLLLHALGLGVERQIDLCQLRDARKALVMMADDRNIRCAEIARKAAQPQRNRTVAEDEHTASGMDTKVFQRAIVFLHGQQHDRIGIGHAIRNPSGREVQNGIVQHTEQRAFHSVLHHCFDIHSQSIAVHAAEGLGIAGRRGQHAERARDTIARLEIAHSLADLLDDADTFVTEQCGIRDRLLCNAAIINDFQIRAAAKTTGRHAHKTVIRANLVRLWHLNDLYSSVAHCGDRFHHFHLILPFSVGILLCRMGRLDHHYPTSCNVRSMISHWRRWSRLTKYSQ